MSKVKQPSWCNYPEADEPFIGCWSLWFGKVKDEDYCKDCECYKNWYEWAEDFLHNDKREVMKGNKRNR